MFLPLRLIQLVQLIKLRASIPSEVVAVSGLRSQ